MAEYEQTLYGFNWGAAIVERCTEHQGQVVITIRTTKGRLDVRVTKSGLIRTDTGYISNKKLGRNRHG